MMKEFMGKISSIMGNIPKPVVFICVFGILLIIILRCIYLDRKEKARKQRIASRRIRSNFEDSGYRAEILAALPEEAELDFTNLYYRLDELQHFIDQNKNQLESLESQVILRTEKKIQELEALIKHKGDHLKRKMGFHYCICVHYASFTLANNIKRQQENIRDVFVKYKKECDKLSKQIIFLNQQIANSNDKKRYEYMSYHKEYCARHQRLSKIKNIFGARNAQYLQMVKAQNKCTKKYRNYIINNFGKGGRSWGKRLMRKKIDLLSTS